MAFTGRREDYENWSAYLERKAQRSRSRSESAALLLEKMERALRGN